MPSTLDGKRIAILATDGVEQIELDEPRKALTAAGATVELLAPREGHIQAFNHADKADSLPVDRTVAGARAEEYDGLVLPGGVRNPDRLRIDADAVRFVRESVERGLPIGVICHGAWTLVEADAVRGLSITSFPSLKTDIRNAGGHWIDREVVVDRGIVSSRGPHDLPAFNRSLIETIAEGKLQPGARQEQTGSSQAAA